MTRFRVVGYGQGNTPEVKFEKSTHEISPEMHSVEISVGLAMVMNLTYKEAATLYVELGEKLELDAKGTEVGHDKG